jgi:hypothetical protein
VWKCGLYFLAGALEKRSTSEANGVRRSTNFAYGSRDAPAASSYPIRLYSAPEQNHVVRNAHQFVELGAPCGKVGTSEGIETQVRLDCAQM